MIQDTYITATLMERKKASGKYSLAGILHGGSRFRRWEVLGKLLKALSRLQHRDLGRGQTDDVTAIVVPPVVNVKTVLIETADIDTTTA